MNYGNLKTHFKDLMNRSDITDALAGTFIDQGISRIQRQLRSPMSERTLEYNITSRTSTITLPADFLELISLYHSTNELTRITMNKYRELTGETYTGKPQYFARQNENVFLYPEPSDGKLVMYYHGEFTQMTTDSDENIIAKVAPDLLIYSALTYASDWFLDERAELFENKFNQFMLEVQEQANDQELNGSLQVINPSYRYE